MMLRAIIVVYFMGSGKNDFFFHSTGKQRKTLNTSLHYFIIILMKQGKVCSETTRV